MVNPNAAYDKFKDKHVTTKGLGQFTEDDKLLSTGFFDFACFFYLNFEAHKEKDDSKQIQLSNNVIAELASDSC